MKTNSELFNLLSDSKMFDSTVELVAEFKTFKEDLLKTFWLKLLETFRNSEKLSQWSVESEINDNADSLSIYFTDINDLSGEIYFLIYYEMNSKDYEFVYGVQLNQNSDRIKNYEIIYEEAKKFKENEWKIGSRKAETMPIWYSLDKNIDFRNNLEFKKILPNSVDSTVKEISEMILDEFTDDIKDFIRFHLKGNRII